MLAPVVVEVREAAKAFSVARLDVDDVLEGGDRVGVVGRIELRGTGGHPTDLHPGGDVLGGLLRLRLHVRNEGLHVGGQLDRNLRMSFRHRGCGCSHRSGRRAGSGSRGCRGKDARPDGEAGDQEEAEYGRPGAGDPPVRRRPCPGNERLPALRTESGARNHTRPAMGAVADWHRVSPIVSESSPRA